MDKLNNLQYKLNKNQIDEYGVDHSNFSPHEELEYNFHLAHARNDLLQQIKNDPNCHITFDGKNLKLYKNNEQVNNLDAMSGTPSYQSAQYQNVPNKGPIPEGTWYADQDQRQSLTFKNALLKAAEKLNFKTDEQSNWSGNPISWGLRRVWLRPDDDTNTYGRSVFSIHGGTTIGSAGCIDIPRKTHRLSNYLDDCQDSVPVKVKYPPKW